MDKQTTPKPAERLQKTKPNLAERFGRTPDGRIRAGPGRPKGVPNVLSGQAKDNIAAVFDRLGGIDEMVKWAEAHKTEFYTRVYPRLLPMTVSGSLEHVQQAERASADLERILTGIIASRKESEESVH
jgi:hypothetical protein